MSVGQPPPLQIVNDSDEPIGEASLEKAYDQGLVHRVVYIIIEDLKGNILLQKRSPAVVNYPNRWDISSAGHVDAGENYKTAAAREIQEELGLAKNGFKLQEIAYFRSDETHYGRVLHRFNKIYKTAIPANTPTKLQLGEVESVRWFSPESVKKLISKQPEAVASGLILSMKYYA